MLCGPAAQTPTNSLWMLVGALTALVAAIVSQEVSANWSRFVTPTLGKRSDGDVCVLLLSLLLLVFVGSGCKFNLCHVKSVKKVVVSAKNLDISLPIDLANFRGKGCITRNQR